MRELLSWIWYWLQLPGCSQRSPEAQADVIVVQAFGRNTLIEEDLANLRRYHDGNGNHDGLTLAWCRDHQIEVGDPNRSLAMVLINMVHQTRLPVVAQWEVILACPPDWYKHHRQSIFCLWPPAQPGQYFTTRRVLEDTVAVMRFRGWRRPLVLAHTRQLHRVCLMLKRLSGAWPAVSRDQIDEFDSQSLQPWTRNIFAWWYRETRVRVHHVLHHWV